MVFNNKNNIIASLFIDENIINTQRKRYSNITIQGQYIIQLYIIIEI